MAMFSFEIQKFIINSGERIFRSEKYGIKYCNTGDCQSIIIIKIIILSIVVVNPGVDDSLGGGGRQ